MAPNATICTNPPVSVPSDAGVAGIGVLLSFMITAGIAVTLSASLIFSEWRPAPSTAQNGNSIIKISSIVRRKLLSSYSDQQILTGIAMQSIGLAKMNTMVPYHFFIIWMLSLLSIASHNATLLALVGDFRRDWVLRWLRQFLMFVNLGLSCVYGVFILEAVRRDLTGSTLPIGCVWSPSTETSGKAANDAGLSFFATIAVIAGNCVIFGLATWYLHLRSQRKFYRAVQAVGLALMAGSAVGATIRVIVMAQAFGTPPIKLSDQGERVWSFGSLLSLGLLLLPVISAIEIIRGEVQCAPPMTDDAAADSNNDDKVELLGGAGNGSAGDQEGGAEMQSGLRARPSQKNQNQNRVVFQPNEHWRGSSVNLV